MDRNLERLEARLDLADGEIAAFDDQLVDLGAKIRSKRTPKNFDTLKKKIDAAVKLRDSWEKTQRKVQVALGIVTERATRAADTETAVDEDNELAKLQADFD